MKNLGIAIALVAISALGVGATASSSPRAAKTSAVCDVPSACSATSAGECVPCPPNGEPCCWPCDDTDAATTHR